ncbi:MAG: helix-turn-helix transcriptional regulator [Pseudomonadales bacterium]
MRPADRLFQIVLQLGRGRVVTARALADRFEVSERTIYRDIADLMGSGVPIDGEAGVGYRLQRGYQVPPMMFDQEELQALLFGVEVAKAWGDPHMAEAADRIVDKIDAVLPQKLRPELLSRQLLVPGIQMTEATAQMLGAVRESINDGVRVFLEYSDAHGQPSERIVWPLALMYWGTTWTLGGWCELRGDFRSFRIDRILSARRLQTQFPDQPGRRLADYLAQAGAPRDSDR